MNATVLKGLAATIFMFILGVFQASGIPVTNIGWELLGITTVGTVVVYLAQSLIIVTTSPTGQINWRDILKGTIIVLGNALVNWGAASLTGTLVDIKTVLVGLGAIAATYLFKQFKTT